MSRVQEIPWVEEDAQVRLFEPVSGQAKGFRINLYQVPWLRPMLASRWPQLIVRLITLGGFIFTLVAAQIGPRVGSRNFAIIMVWITWWTMLKLGFIPFTGRSWCSICPIALPGEWLQRSGVQSKASRNRGIHLIWPKALRGSWLQSGGFLLIGLFSAVTLTDPHITGWVLLGIFILAIAMSLLFEHRAFCSYLCPIGGFSALYAKAAPVELRVLKKEVCINHEEKLCYQACPWGLYPLALKDSSSCGVCLACLRVCPKDNLALNLRPYGTDIGRAARPLRWDETVLALIMLGSAVAFSAVFLGPWGWLKLAALHIGSIQWLIYILGFLAINLFLLPALFSLCVWLKQQISRSHVALRQLIVSEARGLIPLGLMAWIAFTISFALPKFSYVLGVLNDPLGLGSQILGLRAVSASLDVSAFSPIIEVALVIVGAIWAASVNRRLNRPADNPFSSIPLLLFYALYSASLLWLLVG